MIADLRFQRPYVVSGSSRTCWRAEDYTTVMSHDAEPDVNAMQCDTFMDAQTTYLSSRKDDRCEQRS